MVIPFLKNLFVIQQLSNFHTVHKSIPIIMESQFLIDITNVIKKII
jgi:hypothetical protein